MNVNSLADLPPEAHALLRQEDLAAFIEPAVWAPRAVPPEWTPTPHPVPEVFRAWRSRLGALVLCSARVEGDGRRWLHVSISGRRDGKRRRLPSWFDLREVKDIFIGKDRRAISVMPKDGEYVNLAEVLHLFACLDDDGLPDFRIKGGI